ncbi:hypothetical protein F5884DRAFT_789665 [Xylogone sp. PMI_703]|nr:hypothetical protein F5884DRAFT_789665 [Xylogone sp. PMI_703]
MPPSPSNSIGSGSKSQSSQHQPLEKFPFLSINGSLTGDDEAEKSRKLFVRSYAKRAALEQQRLSANAAGSSESSKGALPAEAAPLAQHVTRFRLAPPANRKEKALKPRARRRRDGSQESQHRELSPSQADKMAAKSLDLSPGRGRVDGFGLFPVTVGLQQQELLYFYQDSLAKTFLNFDSHSQLIEKSATDPAWLNATLSLIALYLDLSLGRQISAECLYHRGEALRLVNERLANNSGGTYDVATIAAVALLANFDITIGALDNAAIHMDGLHELVNLIGGIRQLRDPLLTGLITWADLQYASIWHTPPRFEFALAAVEEAPSPLYVDDLSIFLSELRHPPDPRISLTQITTKLRSISETKDRSMMDPNFDAEFNNCLYLSEYRLLIRCEGPLPENNVERVFRTKVLSLYLYVHVVLRGLPIASMSAQTLADQLRASLGPDFQEAYNLWDEKQALLWALFMGWITTTNDGHSEHFVNSAAHICSSLMIQDLETFKDILKEILWTKHFCEPRSEEMWAEVAGKMMILKDYEMAGHELPSM